MQKNFHIELYNPINRMIRKKVKKEIINDFFDNTLLNKYLGRRTPNLIMEYNGINFKLVNISVTVRFAIEDKIKYREILNLDVNEYSSKSMGIFKNSFHSQLSNKLIGINTITKVSIKLSYI